MILQVEGFSYMPIFLVGLLFMGIGMFVSFRMKQKFKKYSKIPAKNGLTGHQIAEEMLRHYNVNDVEVISTSGRLTDHYNPGDLTVNLSEAVYSERSAAAQAIAAHEVGHAVQHAQGYKWLALRSKLVPVQAVSHKVINIVILIVMVGGYALFSVFPTTLVIGVIAAAYGAVALFAVVTLPVEFDASNRALAWMTETGIVQDEEYNEAKSLLKWAASTYVVAALGAVAQLLVVLSMLTRNR